MAGCCGGASGGSGGGHESAEAVGSHRVTSHCTKVGVVVTAICRKLEASAAVRITSCKLFVLRVRPPTERDAPQAARRETRRSSAHLVVKRKREREREREGEGERWVGRGGGFGLRSHRSREVRVCSPTGAVRCA